MKKVSAFDLDHTLLSVNTSFLFGVYLYRQKVFSLFRMLYLISCYFLHKMGWLSMQKLHHFVFKALFLGKPSQLIKSFVSKYLDQYLEENFYLPAWECLEKAKKRGDYVIILSSSPHFLVEAIAQRIGVDAWDATHYQVDKNEYFCQISRQMQGKDKANYLNELIKKFKITSNEITAYTDSHLDLPFLEAAGKAVGVNPDRILRKICQRNQWEII